MAVFFDYKIQSPLGDPNYLFFEWHNTFPVLAMASYSRNTTGLVHLHFEEVKLNDKNLFRNQFHSSYFCFYRVPMMSQLLYKELHLLAAWHGIQKRKSWLYVGKVF